MGIEGNVCIFAADKAMRCATRLQRNSTQAYVLVILEP